MSIFLKGDRQRAHVFQVDDLYNIVEVEWEEQNGTQLQTFGRRLPFSAVTHFVPEPSAPPLQEEPIVKKLDESPLKKTDQSHSSRKLSLSIGSASLAVLVFLGLFFDSAYHKKIEQESEYIDCLKRKAEAEASFFKSVPKCPKHPSFSQVIFIHFF